MKEERKWKESTRRPQEFEENGIKIKVKKINFVSEHKHYQVEETCKE